MAGLLGRGGGCRGGRFVCAAAAGPALTPPWRSCRQRPPTWRTGPQPSLRGRPRRCGGPPPRASLAGPGTRTRWPRRRRPAAPAAARRPRLWPLEARRSRRTTFPGVTPPPLRRPARSGRRQPTRAPSARSHRLPGRRSRPQECHGRQQRVRPPARRSNLRSHRRDCHRSSCLPWSAGVDFGRGCAAVAGSLTGRGVSGGEVRRHLGGRSRPHPGGGRPCGPSSPERRRGGHGRLGHGQRDRRAPADGLRRGRRPSRTRGRHAHHRGRAQGLRPHGHGAQRHGRPRGVVHWQPGRVPHRLVPHRRQDHPDHAGPHHRRAGPRPGSGGGRIPGGVRPRRRDVLRPRGLRHHCGGSGPHPRRGLLRDLHRRAGGVQRRPSHRARGPAHGHDLVRRAAGDDRQRLSEAGDVGRRARPDLRRRDASAVGVQLDAGHHSHRGGSHGTRHHLGRHPTTPARRR